MKEATVKSLLRMAHTKVSPSTPVSKVWQLLAKRNISLLPVVSEKNTLLGVIGEDDLLFRLVPDYREFFSEFIPQSPDLNDIEEKLKKEILLTAADVMNKKVITIGADQPIFKALSKMMIYKVRSLPVVDDEKRFIGMILEDDIMEFLFRKHLNIVHRLKRHS